MHSVLARARRSQIIDDPFPHLIVHEVLEPDYYRQLATDFPAAEIILDGRTPVSNSNFRYPASAILDDARISALCGVNSRATTSPRSFSMKFVGCSNHASANCIRALNRPSRNRFPTGRAACVFASQSATLHWSASLLTGHPLTCVRKRSARMLTVRWRCMRGCSTCVRITMIPTVEILSYIIQRGGSGLRRGKSPRSRRTGNAV